MRKKDVLSNQKVTGTRHGSTTGHPNQRDSIVHKGKNKVMPKKVKVVESAGKVMATVSWDSKMTLLIDYLPCGKAIVRC